MPLLDKLGDALMRPELKGAFLGINGHPDAKRSDIYHHRSGAEAIAVGHGKQKLKNPSTRSRQKIEGCKS
jgi:hypothetical protein